MRLASFVLILVILVSCNSPASSKRDFQPAAGRGFSDAKPHSWTGTTPHQYPVHGIDVSRYQGDVDWPRARASGVAFAFIKATEGGDVFDPKFERNWAGARRSGIKRGAYHFYYFCTSAAEQAAWFLKNVPRDSSALPPVLDVEWNHASRTCPHKPPPAIVRREMMTFAHMLSRHYGKKPIIYSTVDFYEHNELSRLKGYHFWLRSVADHPSDSYPNQRWLFWQYTGTGRVPGISGNTDINVFSGTNRQWQKWIAG